VRKVYYNISVTSLSVAVAWLVGAIELLQVLAAKLELRGDFWAVLAGLDLGRLGYVVVGLFVATWLCSITVWKTGRVEERWNRLLGGVER
jgi:high-affinity nickel-transport protein